MPEATDDSRVRRLWMRRLAIATVLLATLAVVITPVVLVRQHLSTASEAHGWLRVNRLESVPGFPASKDESKDEYENRKQETAALIKSPMLLSQVASKYKIELLKQKKDPLKFLEDRVFVEVEPNHEFLRVGVRGSKSEEADLIKIVDSLLDGFMRMQEDQRRGDLTLTVTLLSSELENAKHRCEAIKDEIKHETGRLQDAGHDPKDSLELEFMGQELAQAKKLVVELQDASLAIKLSSKLPPPVQRWGDEVELASK